MSQTTVTDSNLGHRVWEEKENQLPFGCHGESDPIMQQAVEKWFWREKEMQENESERASSGAS